MPDGTDTLHGIDLLQFSDQTIPVGPVLSSAAARLPIPRATRRRRWSLRSRIPTSAAPLAGATATIQGQLAGDELTINGTTSGTVGAIAYSFTGDTLTLSGTDTLADYQTALELVEFDSTSDDPTKRA